MAEALALPTPADFPAFPYAPPYTIQTDLMRHLYTAIEGRAVAIIESPTGTGKTLSLLTATLTWLKHNQIRAKRGKMAVYEREVSGSDEPDWVVQHTLAKYRNKLDLEESEADERLNAARKREQLIRKRERARVHKRPRLDLKGKEVPQEEEAEDFALVESEDEAEDDGMSQAMRALVNRITNPSARDTQPAPEPTCTKVYYSSRTHSQLSQLLPELQKLKLNTVLRVIPEPSSTPLDNNKAAKRPYASDGEDLATHNPSIRTVALASRRHLCINEDLRSSGADLDERCRELLNGGKASRCPHLPSMEEESRILDFRDQILATPKDIEELVKSGRASNVCPYFGSRRAIPQAELISLPYNLLLSKSAREALGVDLTDQIVVIDEAHNLVSTLLSLSSAALSLRTIQTCTQQVSAYLQRFKGRLSSRHAIHLKRLFVFLKGVAAFLHDWRTSTADQGQTKAESKAEGEVLDVAALVSRLGKNIEGINLLEIEAYLKEKKVARKIHGYSESQRKKELKKGAGDSEGSNGGSNPLLHSVETFLALLSNASKAGRVIVCFGVATGNHQDARDVLMKYQLLDPSVEFREVVESARCVILAGGTMSPVSEFTEQLFSFVPPARLTLFTCGHIIPRSNLKTMVVSKGPSGHDFMFNYANRTNNALLAELGQALFNLVALAPKGMVVFFPSYAYLETCQKAWTNSGLMDRLGTKKKIFLEPHLSSQTESVLRDYAAEVHVSDSKKGALLLAVVGAKLSEGLNFSDDLARAVIVIGLPFPNLASLELKERMRYTNETSAAGHGGKSDAPGRELYENMCMKAVNQSIGRAIRHRNDWSSLILLDTRYSSPRIRTKLPSWLSEDIVVTQSFGQVMRELGVFFRTKRTFA